MFLNTFSTPSQLNILTAFKLIAKIVQEWNLNGIGIFKINITVITLKNSLTGDRSLHTRIFSLPIEYNRNIRVVAEFSREMMMLDEKLLGRVGRVIEVCRWRCIQVSLLLALLLYRYVTLCNTPTIFYTRAITCYATLRSRFWKYCN